MSITITHSYGFFSCCSIRLDAIIYFININKEFPLIVDSSKQFLWYKPLNCEDDITYEYFEHSDNMGKDIVLNDSVNIDYFENYQFIDYSLLDFTPFNISNADFYGIKKIKSIKSIVGISPTMVLLFLLLFLFLKK